MSSRQLTPATAIAIALAAVAGTVRAQPVRHAAGANAPHLHGRVTDHTSHAPIRGAQIILEADGRFVTSDSTGHYDFADIPKGIVELSIRAARFPVVHYTLRLIGTSGWAQDIELDSTRAPSGVAHLAPVAVTADAPEVNFRMRDFELRRASGRGQYLTDEQIQRSGASNIQDAVRGMRGVDLDCSGTAFAGCRIRMARAPQRCSPEYYVDGQVDNDFGPSTPIRDVIGIEVYTGPTDVPGEFAGRNSGCGVVVLWTRSGPDRKRKPREP